jgi:alkanesulfonate monooxygenase SsuD/methylene tetrahydromethanopterin reductase-like flavin-dependent oxidoreductase (luciferase family)
MRIGMSLPTMAPGFTRAAVVDWSRAIDEGPFSSVSCGERITFHNPEMMVTMAAAAAVTERADVFVNLVVLPLHPVALIAKQLATLDVLCDGRLVVGLAVGGREHDYRAVDASFAHRHQRLDDGVAELRRLWSGGAPFPGADPIGPAPVRPGGPPLLAGAMGPKALARASRWADGVSGFSLTADAAEYRDAVDAARAAWDAAGRSEPPTVVSGTFYALGVDDRAATLHGFTRDYLGIFGESIATTIADQVTTSEPDRIRRALDDAHAAGVDEFVLVPATVDRRCLDAALELVTRRA